MLKTEIDINNLFYKQILFLREERELMETLPIFLEHCSENICINFLNDKDVYLLDFERIICFIRIRKNEECDQNFGFNVNPRTAVR